ncbi:FecCD family ABC transporter permease [Timonella sp. A28]|uniref:FecCD family ABC transporter permease n=1 Tax=Timonella sp. A28 TaxID=3442640 RepID=UPI003EB8DB8F
MSSAILHRRQTLRTTTTLTALAALTSALTLLALCAGDTWLTPNTVIQALRGDSPTHAYIVTELRTPRAISAFVAGFGLGISGAITQAVLRNPLASPDIIGVTAGASTAVVAVVAGGTGFILTAAGGSIAATAVLGGLIAAVAVIFLSWKKEPSRSSLKPGRIVIVGLGINAAMGSLAYWFLLRADTPDLTAALIWLSGSLNQAHLSVTLPALAVILGGTLVIVCSQHWLKILRFDEITIRSLGTRPARAQLVQLAIAVIIASAATAIAGPIAFVAFVSPHIAVRLSRGENTHPIAAALVGSALVLAADIAAREAFPVNLPVGLVTALCGAPFLLWILTRKKT